MRASSVQIPDEIKGVKLNKEQKQALREGKGVFLENMISNRKNPFSATVQVNADKKSLEFIYPNAKQSQEQMVPVKACDARWIRLYIPTLGSGSSVGHLAEIYVYGTDK